MVKRALLEEEKMNRLWESPNGHWYVLYGPKLTRRISARTKTKWEAEKFLDEIVAMESVGVLRERNSIKMVAEYWALSGTHVRRMIKDGKLSHLDLDGVVRVTADQVAECEARLLREATAPDEAAHSAGQRWRNRR